MGRPRKYGLSQAVLHDQKWRKIDAYVIGRADAGERVNYGDYREGTIPIESLLAPVRALLEKGMIQATEDIAKIFSDLPKPSYQQAYYMRHREKILDRLWRTRHPNPTDAELQRRLDGKTPQERYMEKNGQDARNRAEKRYAQGEKGRAARSRANAKYRAKLAERRAQARTVHKER